MPRACSVSGCRTNYKSENSRTVTTYSFPREQSLLRQWLQAIKRPHYVVSKSSAVCIKHFSEDQLLREDSAVRSDGSVLRVRRSVPRLVANAVPNVFGSRHSSKLLADLAEDPLPRRSGIQAWLESDLIPNFAAFKSRVAEKNSRRGNNFTVHVAEKFVALCKLSYANAPKVLISFKVYEDLSVEVWEGNNRVSVSCLGFMNPSLKMDKWCKFDTMLSHFCFAVGT